MPSITRAAKELIKIPLQLMAAMLGPHQLPSREPKLWILMYHRILPATDPRYAEEEPGMLVQPDTLAMHIRELQQLMPIVDLSTWLDDHQHGRTLPSKACAITFDDGWQDNFEYALPILRQNETPATLFAVADMIGRDHWFWPNRVSRLMHQVAKHSLEELEWLAPILKEIDAKAVISERVAQVIDQLKQFSDDQIASWLDSAESQLISDSSKQPCLMSENELCEFSNSSHLVIGSHTCRHYRLNENLNKALTQHEIVQSQKQLKALLKTKIDLFCYPNGDVSPLALNITQQTYKAAVSTENGINSQGNFNLHRLKRIGLHQGVSDTPLKFRARLSSWL